MKFTWDDVRHNECTAEQYYAQFKTARNLEVGKVYKQPNIGLWAETHFKIVFIGEGVALGVAINGPSVKVGLAGYKTLFHTSGNLAGWKYQDSRSCYRLTEEVTE